MESAELIAILREVREKVEARHPHGTVSGISLPDLLPLLHARDAAVAKVAAIGTVNPRPAGPLNTLVQSGKRLMARLLDWHVREQVVFNRQVIEAINATLEALDGANRAISELASLNQQMQDLSRHWVAWRTEWEQKIEQTEVQLLRSVAELQAAFQQKIAELDSAHRDRLQAQHTDFTAALESSLRQMRVDFERLIHMELRLIRQRAAFEAPPEPAAQPAYTEARPVFFDYGRFADRFRGTEEYVQAGQRAYLPYFAGRKNVLDLGCGRGEFLELMRDAGVPARGVDLDPESVALCRHKGLQAEAADLFDYLAKQPEECFDGIFCAQVLEHLNPERVAEMIKLAASRLASGGVIALETPNPECLAIFATHFYLDPTHTRPIPSPLLVFYLEEFGVSGIEVRRLAPAVESMPSVATLPTEFREAFFGGLDYAVIGRKL